MAELDKKSYFSKVFKNPRYSIDSSFKNENKRKI